MGLGYVPKVSSEDYQILQGRYYKGEASHTGSQQRGRTWDAGCLRWNLTSLLLQIRMERPKAREVAAGKEGLVAPSGPGQ